MMKMSDNDYDEEQHTDTAHRCFNNISINHQNTIKSWFHSRTERDAFMSSLLFFRVLISVCVCYTVYVCVFVFLFVYVCMHTNKRVCFPVYLCACVCCYVYVCEES